MLRHIDEISDTFGVPIENDTNIENQRVINVLKNVFDPDISYSIYDMGLIYKIQITKDEINILMTLTTPNCPSAQTLPDDVFNQLKFEFPEHKISVEITFTPEWKIDNMAEYIKIGLRLI